MARRSWVWSFWKAGLLGAVILSGLSGPLVAKCAESGEGEPPIPSSLRDVTLNDGSTVRVEAGELSVPESRRRPTARRVTIPYYRLRSESPTPASPIFLLHGGPGSSWLDQFKNEENYREVAFYRTFADVVLFDQRGGGHSLPVLTCPETGHLPASSGPLRLDLEARGAMLRTLLAECRGRWKKEGVDLAAYNTLENAADVDALRQALGYPKMTLVGGSYGSHLALQVLRLYPERVDRALLFGIEGPDHTWDDPAGTLATLGRIAARTERSPELGPSIPPGGLLKTLERVLARLESAPQIVTVREESGSRSVRIDADLVRLIARHRAGRHGSAYAWPAMILAMDKGDFSLPARAVLDLQTVRLDDPVHYSMDCASGISAERRRRYLADPARALLGDINAEYESLCPVWPAEDLGPAFRNGVVSDIPTLIVHGSWDTSTPIENAREVVSTLRRGQLVEVLGGTHNALYNLYERWPPMKSKARDFLSGKDVRFPATVEDTAILQFKPPAPSGSR